MIYIFIFLSGFTVGVFVAWSIGKSRQRDLEKELHQTCRELFEEQELSQNLIEINEQRQELIEERKHAILALLKTRLFVQTNDVVDMFDISRSTALRYLSELVEEGELEQYEESGRNVRYKLPK